MTDHPFLSHSASRLNRLVLQRCSGRLLGTLLPMVLASPVGAQSGTWNKPNGGAWGTASNWLNSAIPTGSYYTADFSTQDLTANATVTLGGTRTIGILHFGDTTPSHDWTVSTGTLTLDYPGEITVDNRTTTLSAPLAGFPGLTKFGAGTLVLSAASSNGSSTTVNEGTLQLSYSSGATGTLRSSLTINPGASVVATVGNALGYSGTNWVRNIYVNGGSFITNAANLDQGWGVTYYLTGGTLTAGTGARFSAGGGTRVVAYASDMVSTINGEFRLREGNTNDRMVFSVGRGTNYPDLLVSGPITTNGTTRGIEKSDYGVMQVAGTCSYTGPTVVSSGTFLVTGSLANTTTTVASGATLAGSGTLGGPTTISGILSPGNANIATLRINNSLTLAAGSTTEMEITKSGTTRSSDLVQGISTLTLGGTLSVMLAEGSDSLSAGDVFTLISAASRAGSFASINLPYLPSPLRWDTSQLVSQGRITVAKGPQTVTFAALGDVAAGDSPTLLAASASSGLPVSYSSSNPEIASIEGNLLTPRAEGTVTITANQAGDGLWLAASPVVRELRVWSNVKTTQTIAFAAPGNLTHGAPPIALTASSSSGLPINFASSAPEIAEVVNGQLVARFPGTFTLTASQPGNFEFQPAPPIAYEIAVLPGVLELPQSISRTATLGSAPIEVEIPVTSLTGETLAWTASLGGFPSWLNLLSPSGSTPGALRLEFDPRMGPAPGTHAASVIVATAGATFQIPVSFTIESTTPFESYEFSQASDVPVTADGFEATGKNAFVTLRFAPPTGTNLMLIRNTGGGLILGEFSNLVHGQRLSLMFEGVSYPFVANYYGGNGNDLVLQWANVRPVAWGYGGNGELGNGIVAQSSVPVSVVTSGVLADKAITGFDAGGNHNLMLASDGSVASWGRNYSGQLGDGSSTYWAVPMPIHQTGVLAGKTVIAVAGGDDHSLALCRDGTLAAWGSNDSGKLGNGGSNYSLTPVLVNRSGVLADKTVIAIAAGESHSLALCSDGTLAAWGGGHLGNSATNLSNIPILVDQTGVLAGKTVTAIAAGYAHSLVLCSDGTMAVWGSNSDGQLGNGTSTQSLVPVLVNRSGVLAGRTVTAIAAGGTHNLALCADGTLAAWGNNSYGQSGNNSTTASNLPVQVNQTGILAGKTITSISAGDGFSLAICADGTAAAWGYNAYGQLGNNNTTNSSVPVAVTTSGLGTGERLTSGASGVNYSLALVATPPAAVASTLAATAILDTSATLNGSANANGSATSLVFEYGTTIGYGASIAASTANLTGVGSTAVSANLTGLLSGTTYHYRLVATSAGGTVRGADMTFTTSSFAALTSLTTDQGAFWPTFASAINRYELVLPYATETVRFTPAATDPTATVRVDGEVVVAGASSAPLPLSVGSQTVSITVDASDGINAQIYTVAVTRRSEAFTFNAATDVPLTVGGFNATGSSAQFALNFAPLAGTELTVVKVTGLTPIEGTFANLAQGQLVKLTYNDVVYVFLANYYGGSGNDLVLQWANTRLAAWGANSSGQLGVNTTNESNVPVVVDASGVLAGKSIIAMSTGGDSSFSAGHSLVLCADGTLAAWGSNSYGQLGNNTTTASKVPVAVNRSGVLANKLAVAAASGRSHQLVLCADGTLATWGRNSSGQLGVGDTSTRSVPVAVNITGALAGKRVAAIAAGGNFSMALCADGTLAAWGENTYGQLGIGTTANSNVPVLVDRSGVLLGKQIIAISAGDIHALALCADGSIAAWGNGLSGRLGTGAYSDSSVPVLVNRAGALAGKTAVAIAAGGNHSMVLCADGTLATWGNNASHQLGNGTVPFNGSVSSSALPVPVLTTSGALVGKPVSRIFPASEHNAVLCSDATLATWGNGYSGRLGNGSLGSYTPTAVLVSTSLLKTGERFSSSSSGALSSHNLALIASPPAPDASTLAATAINDAGATLNGSVRPNNTAATIFFEYGLTTSYGTQVAAAPVSASGTAPIAASLLVTGLKPGTLYHYRMLVTSVNGDATGEDLTFTTTESATLAGLTLSAGELAPSFAKTQFSYDAMVPLSASSITVTPVANSLEATVRVNGSVVPTGIASEPINLTPGSNTIITAVTSANGVNTLTYTVTVNRLQETYTFSSAASVPVTANEVVLSGENAAVSLTYGPVAGTRLMLINNTGSKSIQGTFGNLPQGAIVNLAYNGSIYPFVVNYYGGTGNDLVLQWANNRLLAWGFNNRGQLGNNTLLNSPIPVPVDISPLQGRTVIAALANGDRDSGNMGDRNLVLCADGALFQWGKYTAGNLANATPADSRVPIAVNQTGILAGRTVKSISLGGMHSLALCTDGALAAWGANTQGQLGSSGASYNGSSNPVWVDRSGVLAGKTITAVSGGGYFSLALCSDGTLAAWGSHNEGQLGTNALTAGFTVASAVPLLVDRTGVLAGKTVVAIAAGGWHGLALCADGTLATWGYNYNGQLGNGSTTNSSVPVLVNRNGVLAGKTVTAIAAADYHNLALCSDGSIAAWGYGIALGNGTSSNSSTPVLVNRSGALSGKTVIAISAGGTQSSALCSDGSTVSWGGNTYGQLGNNSTTDSNVPVPVNTSMLGAGEKFSSRSSGSGHNLAIAAMPPPPAATTLAATEITDTSVVLSGQVNAQGSATTVTFEYGLTDAYGQKAATTPASVSGTTSTAVAVGLNDLIAGATYHFRIVATSAGGVSRGVDLTFTTTTLSRLADLSLSAGSLTPAFAPSTVSYLATVPFANSSFTVTSQAEIATTTIEIDGLIVASGTASNPLPLAVGENAFTIFSIAEDGINYMAYTVTVTRLPESFTFGSATAVPLTVEDFLATGMTANFALGFAPLPGTDLTAVRNTGSRPIRGQFSNLTQGQAVAMTFGEMTYVFVADYFGGSGNDLVLRWANTRAFAWGYNGNGEVGNNSTSHSLVPVPVNRSGALADKLVAALSVGDGYKVVVCHDGTLAAWGDNSYKQAGIASGESSVPLPVAMSGALAGKTLSAVSAGSNFTLGLCVDGTLAAWGHNDSSGQLGNNSNYDPSVPVAVDRTGILKDRRVVAIDAGGGHSLALCDDGTLAAWGAGNSGELGNGTTAWSRVPVRVPPVGALAGKQVVAIAAGGFGYSSNGHSLALCSDGSVAAWGDNYYGQLGTNSTTNSSAPIAVPATGVLAGKSVAAIAAGSRHSLAVCSDGTLVAWGYNQYGQLGNNSTTNSSVPVAVIRTGPLAGKTVTAIAAENQNSYALCSDGTLVAWGYNAEGQLGNNSTTDSSVPVLVNRSNLSAGERFFKLSGPAALVAGLPQDLTPSIADGSSVIGTSQTLGWSRDPLASTYRVFFGTNRDAVAAATDASPEYLGESATPAWTGTQPVLAADTVYFWRVDTHYATGMKPGKVWSFLIAPIEMATSVSRVIIKGMAAATVDVPITSAMTAPQPWTVSGTSLPSWLTLVTATGTTPQALQLRFTPGTLAAGPYQTVLRVVSGAAAFDLPVAFRIVEIDITLLKAHPTRPVVYGLNTAASGETFARLVEIDATTGAMLRTMPIGSGPTDLDLDPVSERLYVPTMANWVHTGTRVVDLTTWTELPSLLLEPEAYKLEVTPTGRLISEGSNQWVTSDIYDAADGTKLATFGGVRAGDCEADPTGKYYYHCDANSSGARIRKYDISNDTFESVSDGPILAYGSFNLILSSDGRRLFWQGFSFAADDLHAIAKLPDEAHATNRSGDLAVGSSALWWADTGTQIAALPFASTVAAISANDTHLVRFNSTAKAIVSTPLASLTDLPGPWPRPGQELATIPQRLSWSPVAGATAYRVFIAENAATLQGMTEPTATVTETYYDLPMLLAAGGYYAWRVDGVGSSGTTAGSVRTFAVRFAEGPAVPVMASSSYASAGNAVSLSDRRMLVGIYDMAQVLDFDPATGATALGQPFTALNGGESVLALDGDKAVFGSYYYDSTLADIGAAYVYRPQPTGNWDHNGPLGLPTPVANEQFGTSVAASGNLLLAGCGEYYNLIGRVGAFITEPTTTRVQTFTAADGVAGDSFGYRIAMEGNQAIIAAPGRGSSYNRVGCLYAFTRSTTTGLWAQTQKIAITGATTSGGSGMALALSGDLLATLSDSGAVVIYTRNPAGQWLQTSSIPRTSVAGSSTSFGADLALAGDLLFIGDTNGNYQGYGGGAVFVFRRSGGTWLAQPTITPASPSPIATYTDFGGALAVRDGWLAVGGGTSRQIWMIRIDSAANRTPQFAVGIPSQGVIGRAFNAAIRADDADGNDSLAIDLLQGPSWLNLTDDGDGNAALTGTPTGVSGDVSDIQLRVRDGDGAEVLYTLRFTLLAPADLPVLTSEPADTTTSVGREVVLSAAATGIGPFQWQWYHDGEPLSGATQATLAFDEIAMNHAGVYQVRVTNTAGEDVSAEFELSVNPATLLGGDWPTYGGSPAHSGRHAAALDGSVFAPAWSQAILNGRMLNRAVAAGGKAFVTTSVEGSGNLWVPGVAAGLDLTNGTLLWSLPVASSYSINPPTVFNGRVYFQRGKGSSDPAGPQLLCLNAETGAQVWASVFGAQWEAYEAPAVSDLGIFMNGGTYGGMYGYNFDGSQRFFLSLSQNAGWTPTIHRGRLFSFVGNFIEHNPANGATLWGLPNQGGTAVISAQGNSAVVVSANALSCYDLQTRSRRWRIADSFTSRPAIGAGRAFACIGNTVRSYALADGAAAAIYQASEPLIGQPIVFNDRLVVSSEASTWVFDLTSGALLQSLAGGGNLSYSNGYLLAAGNDGTLRAFRATPQPRLAVELAGSALAPAAGVDFHAPLVGQSSVLEFTLRNTGLAELTGLTASIVGDAASDYSIAAAPPVSLATGASTTLTVTFTPTEPGTRAAVLQLASNDPAANPFALNPSGKGNRAPSFAGFSATTPFNQPLAVYASKIAAKATDPDGDTVSVSQAFGPASQGGNVALAAGVLTYTPTVGFTGTETVDVELRDANGATIRGPVTFTVVAAPVGVAALGLNLSEFTLRGGKAEMVFRGVPGRVYQIQRSLDLLEWSDLGSVTAGADGKILFIDSAPPAPQGFYRTRSH